MTLFFPVPFALHVSVSGVWRNIRSGLNVVCKMKITFFSLFFWLLTVFLCTVWFSPNQDPVCLFFNVFCLGECCPDLTRFNYFLLELLLLWDSYFTVTVILNHESQTGSIDSHWCSSLTHLPLQFSGGHLRTVSWLWLQELMLVHRQTHWGSGERLVYDGGGWKQGF